MAQKSKVSWWWIVGAGVIVFGGINLDKKNSNTSQPAVDSSGNKSSRDGYRSPLEIQQVCSDALKLTVQLPHTIEEDSGLFKRFSFNKLTNVHSITHTFEYKNLYNTTLRSSYSCSVSGEKVNGYNKLLGFELIKAVR